MRAAQAEARKYQYCLYVVLGVLGLTAFVAVLGAATSGTQAQRFKRLAKQSRVTVDISAGGSTAAIAQQLRADPAPVAAAVAPPPAAAAPAAAEEPAKPKGPPRTIDISQTPEKPDGDQRRIKFYDGNSVTVFPHGKKGDDWWDVAENGWEASSLRSIKTMLQLKSNPTYIDFGAWVGPTVLFAAPYASKTYAFEPDYGAFRELYWNVRSNPDFDKSVDVAQFCISDKPGSLTMRGTPGSSMSTIVTDKTAPRKPDDIEWTVTCMTLDAFCESKSIDPKNLVLKIDTEGAERQILLQLRPWIAKYKPSMLLSMHAFAYIDDEPSLVALREVFFTYKTMLLENGKPVDRKQFSTGGWCRLCVLILSDDVITEEMLKKG